VAAATAATTTVAAVAITTAMWSTDAGLSAAVSQLNWNRHPSLCN
jgi:hypothetical protein